MDSPGDAVVVTCESVFALVLFFAHCGLSTEKTVIMMYQWVHEVKCVHVKLFEEIESWDMLVNYNNFFHLESRNWLLNQNVQLGGFDVNGEPMYVEVDETYQFHRKYHRGHHRRSTWVVGILERNVAPGIVGFKWLEEMQQHWRE